MASLTRAELLADGLSRHTVVAASGGLDLLGSTCPTCGHASFPAARRCRSCGAADLEPRTLAGHGSVHASTVARVAQPGFTAPYAFGYVDLQDGPRVFAQLMDGRGAPVAYRPGTRVQLREVPTEHPDRGDATRFAFTEIGPDDE